MVKWIIASAVAVLALSVGVAYGATQLASSTVTQVCVNDVNGMMRSASVCRDGEHAATIGGGGGQVIQRGTFAVPGGQIDGKTLPLTGVTVSGKCEHSEQFGQVLARGLLEAASGTTMDTFNTSEGLGGGTVGGTSLLISPPLGVSTSSFQSPGGATVIATSNGATATISIGGAASLTPPSCTFLWQAVEAPN